MKNINEIINIFENNVEQIKDWANNFVQIEILFYLAENINETGPIEDLYLLLGSRNIICKNNNFDHNDFLMNNAKNILKTMNQCKVYRDTLRKYMKNRYLDIRLYTIEDGKLIRNKKQPTKYSNREKDYDEILSTPIEENHKKINYINNDDKSDYGYVNSKHENIMIKFDKNIKRNIIKNKKNKLGGDIKVKRKDIIDVARKIDEQFGETGIYREKVITNNPIVHIRNNQTEVSESIVLSKVTHMIGQVGAGKSTFSECLTVLLANKGYRIVVIEPTVMESINKAQILSKLGIKAVSISGNSSRINHINAASENKDFLNEYYSKTLTPACYIGALIDDVSESIRYGEEPCYKIRKFKNKKLENSKRYICPFFNDCPKTELDKELLSAEVIVTTIEGLCSISNTEKRQLLFTYVLNNIDLVIIDEADSTLCRLDSIFAPSIGVDEYIKLNNEIDLQYRKKTINEKVIAEEREFVETLNELSKALVEIWNRIKEEKTGFSNTRLRKFTAMQLLNTLSPNSNVLSTEEKLPIELWKSIYNLMGNKLLDEEKLVLLSAFNNDIPLENKLMHLRGGKEEFQLNTERKIEFIIMLISFDQIYRKLSNLVRSNDNLPLSAKNILNQSFREHQKWLPVAPVGNILGFETKDEDLLITKQFATGRALALKFPYLKLGENGEALGPNVLLMSGTSFAPKSFMHHISSSVNYIIQSEEYKREYISKTLFQYTKSNIKVSGILEERKDENIKKLLNENLQIIINCLNDNENILMVVNKYNQAIIVSDYLNLILSEYGYNNIVTALRSDSDSNLNKENLKRSKIREFDNRILVAPAIAIERGHNIVDEFGNSKFDTLMFIVRPMSNPTDYEQHIKKVNGYIMNKYSKNVSEKRLDTYRKMRKDAFTIYNKLTRENYGLSSLENELRDDVTVTLFVIIQQIFGRLCRIADLNNMKYKPIKVYFMDGAFRAKKEGQYDFLKELILYLDGLMANDKYSNIVKSLYEPFYLALKKGGNISDEV